jgi:hypothetical protein
MAGKLGDAGIQGEKSGTALRAMLSRLVAPSNEAARALDRLGIAVADKDGNLRDMPTILAEMDAAMRDMGSAARGELISVIFGMEASAAATVLLGEAGSEELRRYAESLRETGSAARVAKAINEGTAGALEQLSGQVETLSITLGTALVPVLVTMIDKIMPIIDAVTVWVEQNQELVQIIGWVTAGLFLTSTAMLAVRFAMNGVVGLFWVFNAALGLMSLAAGAAPAVLGGVAVAINAVGAALVAVGRFAWANPIVLVIAAIAGGALLIYRNWDGVVAFFQALWEKLRVIFDSIKSAIAAAFAPPPDWGEPGGPPLYKGPNVTLPRTQGPAPGEIEDYLGGQRALGGPVRAGTIYRWMEEGQELFMPRTDGAVISSREIRALRAGGGARSLRIGDIVINAAQGQSPEEIAREVMRRLERMASQAGVPLHDGGGYAA